jgi:hypothetical protein
MTNDKVFDDFLEKLQLNNNLMDFYEKEIPEEIRLQNERILKLEEDIQKLMNKNPFIKDSQIFFVLCKIASLLDDRGITEHNYKEKPEDTQEFPSLIFDLLKTIETGMIDFINNLNLMCKTINKTQKFGPTIKFEDTLIRTFLRIN